MNSGAEIEKNSLTDKLLNNSKGAGAGTLNKDNSPFIQIFHIIRYFLSLIAYVLSYLLVKYDVIYFINLRKCGDVLDDKLYIIFIIFYRAIISVIISSLIIKYNGIYIPKYKEIKHKSSLLLKFTCYLLSLIFIMESLKYLRLIAVLSFSLTLYPVVLLFLRTIFNNHPSFLEDTRKINERKVILIKAVFIVMIGIVCLNSEQIKTKLEDTSYNEQRRVNYFIYSNITDTITGNSMFLFHLFFYVCYLILDQDYRLERDVEIFFKGIYFKIIGIIYLLFELNSVSLFFNKWILLSGVFQGILIYLSLILTRSNRYLKDKNSLLCGFLGGQFFTLLISLFTLDEELCLLDFIGSLGVHIMLVIFLIKNDVYSEKTNLTSSL